MNPVLLPFNAITIDEGFTGCGIYSTLTALMRIISIKELHNQIILHCTGVVNKLSNNSPSWLQKSRYMLCDTVIQSFSYDPNTTVNM